jgi:hypothetical protein
MCQECFCLSRTTPPHDVTKTRHQKYSRLIWRGLKGGEEIGERDYISIKYLCSYVYIVIILSLRYAINHFIDVFVTVVVVVLVYFV